MKRKNKKNVDRDESMNNPEMSRTNIERDDRMMGAGARGDHSAGNEGIDDPAMSATGEHMRRSSRQHSRRGTDNDRQQGRESTDNDSRDFGGQGGQKEGELDREGTGYTDSNTDDSDAGNPLV